MYVYSAVSYYLMIRHATPSSSFRKISIRFDSVATYLLLLFFLLLLSLPLLLPFQKLLPVFCHARSQSPLDLVARNLFLHRNHVFALRRLADLFDNALVIRKGRGQDTNVLGQRSQSSCAGFAFGVVVVDVVKALFQLREVFSTSRRDGPTCPDGVLLPRT